jgi:hypothetical protein
MVILVSEDSNRYAHLFLIEREYFGFNTLERFDTNEKHIKKLPQYQNSEGFENVKLVTVVIETNHRKSH